MRNNGLKFKRVLYSNKSHSPLKNQKIIQNKIQFDSKSKNEEIR